MCCRRAITTPITPGRRNFARLIARDFTEAYKKCDVMLTPATPGPAFALGDKSDDPVAMYLNDVFTVTVNLAGLARPGGARGPRPKAACRWAFRLIGKAFDEATVACAPAGAIERPPGLTTNPPTGGGRHERLAQPGKFIKGQTGDWEIVIGLEVHAQVLSKSKLFSGASTEFGAEPNAQVSFVDAGMPGMLPVINAKCVEQAVRTGLGLKAKINLLQRFRPQELFLSRSARRAIRSASTRTRLSARARSLSTSRTAAASGSASSGCIWNRMPAKACMTRIPTSSYVDLNRSGIALMEIVTKPDMRSPEEAAAFLKKLRAIVRYLGTCDGNMDEGSMRADVNVSVRKPGGPLGTRCEIKNVNSMRFIAQAVEYEARRQVEVIEGGGTHPPGNPPVRQQARRDPLHALQGRSA